jgi:hypothetical protein
MTDKGVPSLSGDPLKVLEWLEPRLNGRLVDQSVAESSRLASQLKSAKAKEMSAHQQAMLAATNGDVEPLRKCLAELTGDPEVARFIHLPKLTRGQNWRRAYVAKREVQPPEIAEWAVIIASLLAEHYGKRWRSKGGWEPEEYAFALWVKEATGEWPNPLREPQTDDGSPRWSDRAKDQRKRGL